jgi:hypothetical protein
MSKLQNIINKMKISASVKQHKLGLPIPDVSLDNFHTGIGFKPWKQFKVFDTVNALRKHYILYFNRLHILRCSSGSSSNLRKEVSFKHHDTAFVYWHCYLCK